MEPEKINNRLYGTLKKLQTSQIPLSGRELGINNSSLIRYFQSELIDIIDQISETDFTYEITDKGREMISRFESPDAQFRIKMGFNVTKYLILEAMFDEYPKIMTTRDIYKWITDKWIYDISFNSIQSTILRMSVKYKTPYVARLKKRTAKGEYRYKLLQLGIDAYTRMKVRRERGYCLSLMNRHKNLKPSYYVQHYLVDSKDDFANLEELQYLKQ